MVAAHGFPLKYCRLAANVTPTPGRVAVPTPRSMCGRSFGSRPRALVRSFGSRPKKTGGEPTVLICAPAAVVPLEGCRPDALDSVYEPRHNRRERRRTDRMNRPRVVYFPSGVLAYFSSGATTRRRFDHVENAGPSCRDRHEFPLAKAGHQAGIACADTGGSAFDDHRLCQRGEGQRDANFSGGVNANEDVVDARRSEPTGMGVQQI